MPSRVIHGNLSLVTAPEPGPVTVQMANDQSRDLTNAEEPLIASYLEAATSYLDGRDGILGRALMPQTWDYTLPCFPIEPWLALPLAPLQSVTAITYQDVAGVVQTFAAENYLLSVSRDWAPRVHLAYNVSWPGTREAPDAVKVRAIYGYTTVPTPIQQAIVLLVAHWFVNREPVTIGDSVTELPFGVRALLEPYMRTVF